MNKEIKIVYFIHPGGMGHYTAMLANAISKRATVTIIGQKGIYSDHININISFKNVLKYPVGFNLKNALSFKNIFLVNTIRPDIIHITSAYPIFNFFGRFFLVRKYPLVVTVHDPKPHIGELKNNWKSIFEDFFHFLLIKRANKLIVHSEKHKNELIGRGIHPNKIVVIHHGDYNFFTKYSKGNQVEKNSVLFFGRIIEYKGLEYLIKAVPIISKEIHTIKVIIAGKGEFEKYQKLIDNISNEYFEVHNHYIPDDQVAEFFERAEILILPYIEATQSGPLHIAYAFKKPVVATNVGALPEIVLHGKTGLIVPPKDVESLAEAIIKLLKDDKLRKEMGENAFLIMKERMSWDNIAEKTFDVYRDAINEYKTKKK